MTHRFILGATLLAGLAYAGTSPFLEGKFDEIKDTPGLVVYEITLADACEDDGVGHADTKKWLVDNNAHVAIMDRNKRWKDVPKILKEGRNVHPMRVAYIDGVEVDRSCGCRTSKELIPWMIGLNLGKSEADMARAKLGDSTTEKFNVADELAVVSMHRCAGRHMDGFAVLKNLWDRIPDEAPEYKTERLTVIARDMGILAQESEEVTQAIRDLRKTLELGKDDTYDALTDWITLNRIIRDDDATLAWYEKAAVDPERANLAQHQAPNVFVMYLEKGNWAKAGGTIDDIETWFGRWKKAEDGMDLAAKAYASLYAAEDPKTAAKLAKGILKESGKESACSLIGYVLEAKVADKSQKSVANACTDETLVATWEAAL